MDEEQLITSLARGDKARVITVETGSGNHIRKLAALGVLPGVEVEVLQTSPAYVIQVNYTQLALDYDIASHIIVKK